MTATPQQSSSPVLLETPKGEPPGHSPAPSPEPVQKRRSGSEAKQKEQGLKERPLDLGSDSGSGPQSEAESEASETSPIGVMKARSEPTGAASFIDGLVKRLSTERLKSRTAVSPMKSGKRRSAADIHAELAKLLQRREEMEEAEERLQKEKRELRQKEKELLEELGAALQQ